MTKERYKEKLWDDYLAKKTQLETEQKEKLKVLGLKFRDDVGFLYELHTCLAKCGAAMEDERTHVKYEPLEEYHKLEWGGTKLLFREEPFKQLVADMTGIFEDILPLGSIVDLKKDYLQQQMSLGEVAHVRMVITKRFLGRETGYYYPYAAAVYPVGTGGERKNFCFTPELIEQVVFTGYHDETEEAFVYQMKQQLIVKGERKSIGFATMDECRQMEKMLCEKDEA